MSDHYKDMSEMWLKGKYIRLPLREEEFIKKIKDSYSAYSPANGNCLLT